MYTKILTKTEDKETLFDDEVSFGAYHNYRILNTDNNVVLGDVNFQKGPVKDTGLNGISEDDLLAILIHRYTFFQNSGLPCRENAIILTKLEECLMWSKKRKEDRESRNVESTMNR